ncbi:MAG: SGNH/GDSL hydrolase family protein [Endomicrobium sp.]|jgi:lysophospholipase L1-like esterase|nr:SGNH/GDSL hydrolase family protein [Endomicrobium sp.]
MGGGGGYHHTTSSVITEFIKSVVLCEVTKGKKIIVYGNNELARSVRSELNIDIAYYCDDDVTDEDNSVRNVYDLAYEEYGKFFVVVIQPNYGKYHIFDVLTKIGLIEMTDYCMGVYVIDYKCDLKYYSPFLRDVYLGFNRIYFEHNNKYPGFKVFGKPDSKALRIVTLGGSTTDPIHAGVASWPELLYYLLKKLKIDATIFNGGFGSYTSSNELIKCIRDVIPLNPDVVISYSGVNDIWEIQDKSDNRYKRPFIDKNQDNIFKWISQQEGGVTTIYGMQTDSNVMQYWLDNHKIMHSVCNAFNIKHISILQAIAYSDGIASIFVDKHEDMKMRLVYGENYEKKLVQKYYVGKRYAYIESKLKKYNYILNFRHIFNGLEDYDVYTDSCHVYERGNEIIAANIYEELLKKGYLIHVN